MRFTITQVESYIRGDLYDRQTAEETKEFLEALSKAALTRGIDRVLVSVHASRAIFRVQGFGISEFLDVIASRPAHRVALVSDRWEGQLAQQYVANLAMLRPLMVKAFGREDEAIGWLKT